ncbi:hypothetical protein TBLA_0D03480 [Henningerozyma blattae CBS 6284]|uniref:Uncharacterized protein n=1 Tax=Henningerozyma blattae (strain ATCC 34711 / CBS 6284 / DSM 70876 / NBRC 10599 / NRRL Y-10934 / UCD 77-7) TaxID=1071380 RepID=I2H396_HENB6|nr:hypothetical protein TBLA_0D03480 [Tetrapisispora blattae CBS 6284]CCH60848.1 hypothetical protein TBLA_0D03480 [Tetrapisispora blattae CBS 6284]
MTNYNLLNKLKNLIPFDMSILTANISDKDNDSLFFTLSLIEVLSIILVTSYPVELFELLFSTVQIVSNSYKFFKDVKSKYSINIYKRHKRQKRVRFNQLILAANKASAKKYKYDTYMKSPLSTVPSFQFTTNMNRIKQVPSKSKKFKANNGLLFSSIIFNRY